MSASEPADLTPGPAGPTPEPYLLELRIHGVNNTPVPDVLGLAATDIERCDGDELGGFWTPTAVAVGRARAGAERRWGADGHHPDPQDWVPPDYIARGVRREAYSWGAQSRVSGRVPGGEGSFGVRLTRAGWLLLAPLGLTNAAYWSRRLVPDTLVGPGSTPVRRFGRGFGSTLLFGLGLTLLLVASLETVSLDLVATQCLGGPACPSLPGWLSGLGALPWGRRMAVGAVVPVAGLALLQWLSAAAKVRYDIPVHATGEPSVAARDPLEPGDAIPVLSQPDLWRRWRLAERTGYAHLAAGLSLIAGTLAAAGVWGAEPRCRRVADFSDGACWTTVGTRWPFACLLVAAFVALVGAAALLVDRRSGPLPDAAEDTLRPRALLWAVGSAVLLVGTVAALWFEASDPPDPSVPGLSVVPSVLVAVMLLIALVGLTWRRGRAHVVVASGACVLLAGGVAWGAWPTAAAGMGPVVVVGVAMAAVVGVVASGARTWAGNHRETLGEAWWGAGPGVFLLLGLGLQMALCSTLVVAVGDWLNGALAPACLVPLAGARLGACPDHSLTLPPAFATFIAGVAGSVVLTLAFALVPVARRFAGRLDVGRPSLLPLVPAWLGSVRQRAGRLETLVADPAVRSSVLRARGRSDLVQRAESVIGSVALGLGVALVSTVLITPGRGWLAEHAAAVTGQSTVVGLWIIVAGWTYGLARVLTTTGTDARPAGLLWDLMCFLPRTAHPFGPPCYADRAVPEIAARVDAWLSAADLPPDAPERARRRVVIAPHSMGVVLAIGAVMLAQGRELRAGRVALLSYGTQVRPYFGRFFPELLGPGPLGTTAVRCAGFDGCVWHEDRRVPDDGDAPRTRPRLVDLLTPREEAPAWLWLSLWRPTDPLGMQVAVPGVDRQAEEVDAAGYLPEVAGHGGYPRTAAYRAAFDELVDRLTPG